MLFKQHDVKIFQDVISSVTVDNSDSKIPNTYRRPRHGLSRKYQVSVLLADQLPFLSPLSFYWLTVTRLSKSKKLTEYRFPDPIYNHRVFVESINRGDILFEISDGVTFQPQWQFFWRRWIFEKYHGMKYEIPLCYDRGRPFLRLWVTDRADMWIAKGARQCQELDWQNKNISRMIRTRGVPIKRSLHLKGNLESQRDLSPR